MSFFIKDTEIKIGFLFAASVAALLCFDVGTAGAIGPSSREFSTRADMFFRFCF